MLSLSQLPNLITIARIAMVPVLILLLKDEKYAASLAVFVIAGVSDGLDGYIAKRFHFQSRLGSILDPIADKILLLCSYVMLVLLNHIPFWLMLTVVFRDLLIVGGYLIYTSMIGPVHMNPSWLSKFNTFLQISLVIIILGQQTLGLVYAPLVEMLIYGVLLSTVVSGAHYLWIWLVMKDVELVKERHD
ncbi:MAG: CDP-alcohol phosphatidyltransferase family protein [Gammaproteobacteria bacterium]|nr:CDP-alcohol phosphatidyltransferase family protein [Gammaproteobacteria bacterium]MDH3407300.1 CDP-alcohol phosphatidyltransferase family protein [Gammaproteobacteria bacterium]MDH3563844.1 CDP-alcohol phosphatidyltransferase family protein [Gammaproteobacteria bacterium]MDH5488036.1 CDP-alcohol phosphatidyltransferase family protein [Gammaproteobacteria bacterium]